MGSASVYRGNVIICPDRIFSIAYYHLTYGHELVALVACVTVLV